MHSRGHVNLLRRLIAFNTALTLLAVGAGWLTAVSRGVVFVHSTAESVRRDLFLEDAAHILATNLHAAGALLAGACTLGVLTAGHLGWLGFSLGHGLSAVWRGSPGAIPLVLRYVPVEFFAFVLTASAAQALGWMALRCLAMRERMHLRGAVALLVAALLLLAVAAGIEAGVKPAIAALGRANLP